jgi:hypothetical protein
MSKSTVQTSENAEPDIQVLKQGTCPTTSGKSTLTYQVGIDGSGEPHLSVISNSGGGFFTAGEWIAFSKIQAALTKDWPEDQPLSSVALSKLNRGKSANNAGFLCAVLVAEKLLAPVLGKTRLHQACDPAAFLASVQALRKDSGKTSSNSATKKPATKATEKATAKAKATSTKEASTKEASTEKTSTEKVKTPAKAGVKTAKTSGKSPASSRKTK